MKKKAASKKSARKKKSAPRDLAPLERSSRRVKGGVLRSPKGMARY